MLLSARRAPSWVWVTAALIGITVLAAGLRFYQLDHLPPGLSYDEAWNDWQALRVVQGQAAPVYFVDEQRDVEEPLHIYLIAGLFALFGPQVIGGRIVSALLGTLTIPLLFLATREMLSTLTQSEPHTQRKQNDLIALTTALVLATFYWHVHYTRLGMEPPAVPFMATLTAWLLWRAFNHHHWLDYGLAGGALGLNLYTHPSARFLPIVVVLFIIYRWAGHISNLKSQNSNAGTSRALIRREMQGTLILAACALIVFAPLGLFFAQHPDLFFYRAGQASVMTWHGGLQPVLENTIKVIGGLAWRGDANLRLNLPGRPGLDIVQLILLVCGLMYALGRERRRVLVFPILWASVMLLPSVLSDAAPHFGRMLGATPALAILIALGAVQISNLKSSIPNTQYLTLITIIAAALGYSTLTMTRDYFVTWARDPGLFTAFDVGLRESAEYLAALPGDELLSLSPVDRNQPIFRFALRDDVSRLKTFNGRRCVVYPVEPQRAFTHIAIVAEENNSLHILQQVFPAGQHVRTFKSVDRPYAIAYQVKAGTRAQLLPQDQVIFDDRIALMSGPAFKVSTRAGDTLPVTLTWQSLATVRANYTAFVHLALTPDSPPIAQEDAQPCDNSYPTTWWTPGEIIQEYRRIVIPPNTPPGEYALTTGLYDLATGKRLPVQTGGDQVVLGTVTITP